MGEAAERGGGKRRAVTAAHRPVWLGPADMGPSRKNRTHNNRQRYIVKTTPEAENEDSE